MGTWKGTTGIVTSLAVILLAICLEGQTNSTNTPKFSKISNLPPVQADAEPIEIAEGEYAIFNEYGGVGPVDAEIYNFHEDWSLSSTPDGKYEVEGTREFESPKDFPTEIHFLVRLSHQLQLTEAREDTSLIWVLRSAPLTCVFRPQQLLCAASGHDPEKNADVSLALDKPYAFSWPLSAFSLAALTSRLDRHPGRSIEVQFVDIEQPSSELPIMPIITNGTLRFIGQENIFAAARNWEADKFELQAFMSPLPRKSLLWISKGGLLLVLEDERANGAKGRLELIRFEQESPSSIFP